MVPREKNNSETRWRRTAISGLLCSSSSSFFRVQPVNAASYVNPCKEFGVAEQLNALYNDPVGQNEKCSDEDGQSHKCSGVFINAWETGLEAREYRIWSGIAGDRDFGIHPPNYTIGIESLTSTVCPPDIVDGEYPGFCPDPTRIEHGSLSFSYIRRDIAPSLSEVRSYIKTEIDPHTGQRSLARMLSLPKRSSGPLIAHPGGGMILMQEDTGYTNPDVVLPGGRSSFWDSDRVGNFWPMDGATYRRSLCGNGPTFPDMYLGISGPIQNEQEMQFWLSNNCPPNGGGWEEATIPKGYESSCSESKLENVDAYYDHWLSNIEKLFNVDCTSDKYNLMPKVKCNRLVKMLKEAPQAFSCGISPEYFDKAMVPLAKSIPYKVLTGSFEKYNIPKSTTFQALYGFWNEVAIKAWNGVALVQLGAHFVFWYDETEGSKDLAYQRAEEFYIASGINGGANIRIPVVYRNQSKLYIDPDDDFNEVFSCPPPDDELSAKMLKVRDPIWYDDELSAKWDSRSRVLALSLVLGVGVALGAFRRLSYSLVSRHDSRVGLPKTARE